MLNMSVRVCRAGSRRGIGVNEERDQTLNQLLTELDGFEGREGVLLLAATNRSEVRLKHVLACNSVDLKIWKCLSTQKCLFSQY